MSHTFHVAFLSHTASKRKYCFSVPEAETRSRCGNLLRRQMQAIQVLKPRPATTQEWIRQAAEGVALQVLRDAVIPPHEKTSDRPVQKPARSGSVSIAYDAQAGRNEAELGPLQPSKPSVGSERMGGMMGIQTGKELVLLCRQNSLLPGLLELLQAGIGSGPGPGPGQEVAHDHIRENSRPHEHELTRKEGYRARAPGGMV